MSWAVLGGMTSAAVAAACFDGGLALQALDARAVARHHNLKASLLLRLARQRRWLAATGLAFAGWPFHLVALGLAPLSLVQPTLALGLVLLLYLGHRVLGEPVGGREIAAVAGLVAAVALLAWAAPPETSHHASGARLAAGLLPLAALALLPLLLDRLASAPATTLPLAAGAAYAFTGISSKLVVDELRLGSVSGVLLWAGLTAALGFAGLLLEMSALQRRPATHVGPMVFVVQVTIPVLLAPLVSGESWAGTPLAGGVILAAVAGVVVCAVTLTRSPAIAAFTDDVAGRYPTSASTSSAALGKRP
jgi:drug/metabolite transporter (DMT)-like permease